MKQTHVQEKQQFKKLFKQEHIDNFEDRFKVLEAFLQTEKHVSVDDLVERLVKNGWRLKPEFVRETLKLMCRFGFAHKSRFDNGVVRYEHRHLGQHHDHMICTKCRKILEFEEEQIEQLQIKIAATHGFHMLQHKLEIYGICNNCIRERIQLMPLTVAKPGERLVIKEISGGTGAKMRLLSMGLRIEDRIEVITNNSQGQLAIAADLKRFVLGRGLAEKIMVEQDER
ncbi:Fur family transcriptional regulator [Alkalispirochaeta odontotermitis]|nr:Fur family transcriptional regulator [Alkalispirochaeta odontotermitis]CAB1083294.1 Ferric uptake regulation protein FUR [Olavius algarvensis Delta 1 endosymbiont]